MNKQITIDAQIFIIPNDAFKYDFNYDSQAHRARKIVTRLNEANGFNMVPEDTLFVETWWTNDDSDNILRHGIEIDGGFLDCGQLGFLEDVPYEIIKDLKEGQTITLRVNDLLYTENDEDKVDVTFNLTANQLSYRYRRFGTFEETLRCVL